MCREFLERKNLLLIVSLKIKTPELTEVFDGLK
jgi:hypothetical protein